MAGSQPKYSLIADQLMREIGKGQHQVGSYLPTESELMRAYGVSRNTVRAAVQNLRTRGVVSSRQGQGSKVIAALEKAAFAESIQSIDELIAFGHETRRVLLSHEIIKADAELADHFRCAPGRRLARAKMLRQTLDEEPETLAIVTLWMDALLETAVEDLSEVRKSAAEIIRQRFGYETNSVVQTIHAESLGPEDATMLGSKSGDPTLVVTRVYSAAAMAQPFLVARSLCRADNFRVVSKFTSKKST